MSNIHHIQVHFGDTDGAGIVYYPNFYRWMDQATHELFKAKGLSLPKLKQEQKVILPLVEAKCNFKNALFHDDNVDIHSQVIEIKNKIIKLEHRFVRNQIEIASGYEIRVWTLEKEGKLNALPIPDMYVDLLKNEVKMP